MRIPFLMLLLALWAPVSYANLPDLPSAASNVRNLLSGENTSSNKTTTSPKPTTSSATTIMNPLLYGKGKVAKEIMKFAENFVIQIFNYKRFACITCFPIDANTLDLPDLLAVKVMLKKLFGKQYDNILQLKNVGDKVWKETMALANEIVKIKTKSFNLWSDILNSLEGKKIISDSRMGLLENNNKAVVNRFVKIVDIEKIRAVLALVKNVFGPALNMTLSFKTLVRAKRQYENSFLTIQGRSLNDETDIVYVKAKLAKSVGEYVNNIFINLFSMEEWAKDHIGGFGKPVFDFGDFSLRTLIIFDYFIKDIYGDVVSKIPVKPKSSYAEIEERSSIAKSIQSMANKMVDLWSNNLKRILHGNNSVNAEKVKNWYEYESNVVSYMVKLEDLRLIHRKALAVFGGAFDAINSEAVKSSEQLKKLSEPLEFDSNVEIEITRNGGDEALNSEEAEYSNESATGPEQYVEKLQKHSRQNIETRNVQLE